MIDIDATPQPASSALRPRRTDGKPAAISLASALLATLMAQAAAAQTNDPPAPTPDAVAREILPPVVVVAQKEPAPSQSLPVSVTPVTAETLDAADIHLIDQAQVYAPNVFLNEFSARKLSNPYIRGIGSSPNNPGVTTYFDGVPQLNANSSSIELIDVEQIEFVRGPQGALFGRNTIGGLINVLSRPPSTTWRADAQGEYGNYDYRDIRLTLSGPLAQDRLAASAAAGFSARDGYTINDVTGHDLDRREAIFGKTQLSWTPAQGWEARLIISGERARDGDYALGDLAAIRARPLHVSRDFEGFTRRDLVAPTLLLNHTGTSMDFSMSAGLVWWKTRDLTDLDYSPIPAVRRDNREKDFQFTDEFRLASAKDSPVHLGENLKLKWQTGLMVFTQHYEQQALNEYSPGILYQADQYGPGIPPTSSPANIRHAPDATLDDFGLGAYAQASLVTWEKLELGAGLHGDYERKDADLKTFFETPDPFLGPPTRLNPGRDFCEVSPQFSLAWHVTHEKTLYATAGRGYKAGGFNPLAPSGRETYGEESSWNYEAGAKSTWFDGRLLVNVAAFYIHWDDLQLNLPTGAPGQFYIANAGAADSKGVELELLARPLKGWDIFGGFGWTDARFLSGAQAGHTDAFGNDSLVDVSGRHLIYAPDFTVNGGMQFSWEACRQATLYVRGEAVAYGRYFYNPVNTAAQDTYSLANFRAGVRGKNWFAEGWVRNAFDTRYVPIAFEFPNGAFGGSGFVGESGAPLTYGLRAGVLF